MDNAKLKEEIREIRQVLDDAMVRIDKAFLKSLGGDDLAQAMKALISVKKRLKELCGE